MANHVAVIDDALAWLDRADVMRAQEIGHFAAAVTPSRRNVPIAPCTSIGGMPFVRDDTALNVDFTRRAAWFDAEGDRRKRHDHAFDQ